jgi:hypothetical protein
MFDNALRGISSRMRLHGGRGALDWLDRAYVADW